LPSVIFGLRAIVLGISSSALPTRLWRGCRVLAGREPLFWIEAATLAALALLYYYFTQIDLNVNMRGRRRIPRRGRYRRQIPA